MFVFQAGRSGGSLPHEVASFSNELEHGNKKTKDLKEMFYFPAASIGAGSFDVKSKALENEIASGLRNRLLSYANVDDLSNIFEFWLEFASKRGGRLFLDSGAYSANSRGAAINIDEYIEFIKEHEHELFCYSSLDVIADPDGTMKNHRYMKKKGLKPVGVFHVGSDYKNLEKICKENDYIALGGMVPHSARRSFLKNFLDSSWSIIKKHWPIKVHAFGVTSSWALTSYPFYSCDSTSAIVGGGMGRIVEFTGSEITVKDWKAESKKGRHAVLMDKEDSSNHLGRRVHNIREMYKFEKFLTSLWAKRGITWDE